MENIPNPSQSNPNSSSPQSSGSGLEPNIAAMLSYLLGPLTGILFLVLEKSDKFVRFHAWQSTVLGIATILGTIAFQIVLFILGLISFTLILILSKIFTLVILGYWILVIYCMVKAYQGQKFVIPHIGQIAEKQNSR